MIPSRVIAKWSSGQPASCLAVHLTDPSVCELISLMEFDCIWIDLEHDATSEQTAGHMIRAARAGGAGAGGAASGGAYVMVRPARGEFARAARMFELGAKGIMYPRCESAEEARELVRWTKFARIGERG